MLRQLTLLAALSAAAGGCASLSPVGAPSCDGHARRPLNRSLWAWEAGAPASAPPSTGEHAGSPAAMRRKAATPGGTPEEAGRDVGAEGAARTPALDIAASLQACGGTSAETRHG